MYARMQRAAFPRQPRASSAPAGIQAPVVAGRLLPYGSRERIGCAGEVWKRRRSLQGRAAAQPPKLVACRQGRIRRRSDERPLRLGRCGQARQRGRRAARQGLRRHRSPLPQRPLDHRVKLSKFPHAPAPFSCRLVFVYNPIFEGFFVLNI